MKPAILRCAGRPVAEVVAELARLATTGGPVIATGASPELHAAALAEVPAARWCPEARAIVVAEEGQPALRPGVLVLTAGTADLPVAHEAALTAELMGSRAELVADVGVAGVHRLLDQREALLRARAIVVVAGMEGALPSVVAGLVGVPVIAVPTSVGYGASFGGLAALLSMLTTCAPGVATVNIDDGCAAGVMAALINRL